MTTITVATDEVGVHEQTLAANVQDDVTFEQPLGAGKNEVRVVNVDGAAAIYFTVNGDDVDLTNKKAAHWVPAVAGATKTVGAPTDGEIPVKLKAAATVVYSVEAG